MPLHDAQRSADTHGMDKFIIGVLFVGSLLCRREDGAV
jgi:hypothetical protein